MAVPAWVQEARQQFPALQRQVQGRPVVYLDGPAGTQVPQSVIQAMGDYLTGCNANHGGCFLTSRESDELLEQAHRAVADLVGTEDPGTVAFGLNMTSLTFALSHALARTWRAGDEIIVTRLEHDANFTPWVLAARDAGAVVRYASIRPADCTLDLEQLQNLFNDRTRFVAIGCASNATGTINPIAQICEWARQVGALSFLDAVHFAPHDLIDVQGWNCDFLVCSAYKFFGPHVGILWGKREVLERLVSYKVRPAPDDLPGKWMTGTQNHEGIAGTKAAIDYLADLGRSQSGNHALSRRAALRAAYSAIREYETSCVQALLQGLESISEIKVWGITDRHRLADRVPTVSLTHARRRPIELAEGLGRRGFFVWHGNYYAQPLTEALGLEPDGMLRVGFVHYNTLDEIHRFLEALTDVG
jgi:cysteine desulfurase family protein (TIGR01976 family)